MQQEQGKTQLAARRLPSYLAAQSMQPAGTPLSLELRRRSSLLSSLGLQNKHVGPMSKCLRVYREPSASQLLLSASS